MRRSILDVLILHKTEVASVGINLLPNQSHDMKNNRTKESALDAMDGALECSTPMDEKLSCPSVGHSRCDFEMQLTEPIDLNKHKEIDSFHGIVVSALLGWGAGLLAFTICTFAVEGRFSVQDLWKMYETAARTVCTSFR